MKKRLLENFDVDVKILSETVLDEKTGDKILKAQVKTQHADKITGNGNLYRRELLQREIDRVQEDLKKGKVFGAAYHPQGGSAEVPDVAMIWRKVWMESDGSVLGEVDILPTRYGKEAQVIIRAGGTIGFSSRGYGTTTKRTKMVDGKSVTYNEVNNDYKMKTPGDIVLSPSIKDTGIQKIIESQIEDYEYIEQELDLKSITLERLKRDHPEILEQHQKEVKEKMEERLQKQYDNALFTGYRGNFDSFKKLVKDEPTAEDKKNFGRRYQEALNAGFKGSFAEFVKMVKDKK